MILAIDRTMQEVTGGRIRLVASQAIEIEVRLGTPEETRRFHSELRALRMFESFPEGPAIRRIAGELADRLQASGRKGQYADLIHVATAIASNATELWTLDQKMVKWHTEGPIKELRITKPYLTQGVLDL